MHQYIGMTIGSYQIIEQIGQGGMATVYRAYQPSMDRYVAIKILPSRFTEDESFVGRFTQEARTLARLEHPHILPVHDYGEQEGVTYLVMRYVKAGTLKDLAREGPMEPEEATRILSEVGRALDYAHSQGVVHRDIKPANVLIDQQGNTFLTDFGIAKLVAETAQFTASGAIIGTPAYMSPEQGLGQPVDHRCDIYSLGVVLYELVTGRVPFEAETPLAVLLKHVNDPLPPPRLVKPDLPEAMERVILKATAKSPDSRYQSAQEMVDALGQAVAAKPAESAQPPPVGAREATTLVRSGTPPLPPVVKTAPLPHDADTAPPPPPLDTSPPPTADATPSPTAIPMSPRPTPDAPLPMTEPASQARPRKTWLLLVGGVLLLGLLLVAGLMVIPNLIGGEPAPTEEVQMPATPAQVSQVQATPMAENQSATTAPPAAPGGSKYPTGWANYSNGNFVLTLARQDDALWAGGDGGLVRWDLADSSYRKFGIADGLASGFIHDLLVDRKGILWIATDAGISRYDGETITSYDETDGLDANTIQALYQDESGGLWAGSHGGEHGLNYYDGESWGLPPVPPMPGEDLNVQVLVGSQDQGLYVGLEDGGLNHFDGEGWATLTSADGLPDGQINDALLTADALWVSTDPAVARIDLETGAIETVPQYGIHTMHQTASGDLWFGGIERAARLDGVSGDWQEFGASPGPIPAGLVTDILGDEAGLWFGTYGGGVAFYDGSDWQIWTMDEELGGNLIEAIRQDKNGVLWFMHPSSGLSQYEPNRDAWQVFGAAEGASDWPSVPAIDSFDNLWIGDSGELVHYDGQGWQRFRPPELAAAEPDAIEIDPHDVQWLVIEGGLIRHDPATDEWTTFTGSDHPIIENIKSVLATSDGTLWIGGEQGLARYDGTNWSTPEASGDAPQSVEDLAEAPDGSLWVAADGELGHLADGRWSYQSWPDDRWLGRVAVGPDGVVWVGYEGLGRYDPITGAWQTLTPDDGLVHSIVQSIHVTPEGVVWVGTDGGLSRYVPPD